MTYDGADERRAQVIHHCSQTERLERLEQYEAKQNGHLAKLEEQVAVLLLRIPADLDDRLRSVEMATASRTGAVRFAQWAAGFVGFAGAVLLMTWLLGQSGVLHKVWLAIQGGGG